MEAKHLKHLHASHPKVINRLKRAGGHLQNVVVMLEEGRSCLDIVQQLQAVESAIHAAKKTLIHDHLDNCLDAALQGSARGKPQSMDEFKTIAKYL
jgi:uncharacterized protein